MAVDLFNQPINSFAAPLSPFGPTPSNNPLAPLSPLIGPGAGTPVPPTPPPTPTPPAAVPEAATPNTAKPTAANPATPPALPLLNVPEYFNAIDSQISAACDPNCLNPYFQSTYHWRMIMATDADILSQLTNTTGVQEVYGDFSKVKQITIAESGVTAYNIKDVQFATVMAGTNNATGPDGAQNWIITITEPCGISFMDAMVDAAASDQLNVRNFRVAPFYLECSFLQYDESGNFVPSPTQGFSTGGKWLWALSLVDIDVKLNEAGAVYTLTLKPTNEAHMTDQYDLMRTPQSFHAVGATVGELFTDYIKKLNNAWKVRYGGELIVFEDIVTREVGAYFKNPASAAAGMDPKNFKMIQVDAEKNPNRAWTFKDGKYSVDVVHGYTISNFIVDTIKHTAEGQTLARNDAIATTTDQSGSSTNQTGVRESITFVVEPHIRTTMWDKTTGNYQRKITFYVSPNYSQGSTLSDVQINAAKSTSVQSTMVGNYIANGLLKKRYDYIFTGENTEILDFDLHFKANWQAIVGNYNGALMRYDATHVNQRTSKITESPQYNLPEVPSKTNLLALGNAGSSVSSGTTAPAPIQSVLRVTPGTSATPQVSSITAIDLLNQSSSSSSSSTQDFPVPLSLWQGNNQSANHAGTNLHSGQQNRDQTVVGSIFAQMYGNPYGDIFTTIKLMIRGDPFWLGQTNIHRQVQLLNNQVDVSLQKLPDFKPGTYCVYVTFRYPVYTDDETFKPELRSSVVFNGVYQVTNVDNHFTDGVFKQELTCKRLPLINTKFWSGVTNNSSGSPSQATHTGGAGSNPSQVQTSGPSPAATTGTAVGASPSNVVGKDAFIKAYTPLAQEQSARTGVAPEVILAQAGLETGWGAHAPQNNFFGIKGGGASLSTTEVINGQTQTVNQNFAGYATPADSFQGYGNLLNTPRYAAVSKQSTITGQVQAIKNAGYATDPDYVSKVSGIANNIKLPVTTASNP